MDIPKLFYLPLTTHDRHEVFFPPPRSHRWLRRPSVLVRRKWQHTASRYGFLATYWRSHHDLRAIHLFSEYTTWSAQELQTWLDAHNVPYPSGTPSQAELQAAVKAHWDTALAWTSEQYNKAQVAFSNLKADAFDTWDESRLREFLLEQGVVNPSGPREQLALLAKQKWRQYSAAASAYSETAASSASSLSSIASARASTAVYGDSLHKASKSASSVMAQATENAVRVMDDSKDYVYSTSVVCVRWSIGQV